MKIEDYVKAMEQIKEMQEQTSNAIAFILGALKGEMYKAKKMPKRLLLTT